MSKEKWYVTEDYYGGVRISTVPTNATNIDGSGSIFENTGRGAGDIDKDVAEQIVEQHNKYDTLKASHDKLVEALRIYGHHGRTDDTTMCEHMKHSDYPCTCGFQKALKEVEKIT